jgi:hypothetical protein
LFILVFISSFTDQQFYEFAHNQDVDAVSEELVALLFADRIREREARRKRHQLGDFGGCEESQLQGFLEFQVVVRRFNFGDFFVEFTTSHRTENRASSFEVARVGLGEAH